MSRPLPRSVVVGYRTYRVDLIDAATADAEKFDGCIQHNLGRIYLDERMSPPAMANTLLHEILHACWYMGGLYEAPVEEVAVVVLSNQLSQVIRDNPDVVKWIAANIR
jgi:hypothetical protein